MPDPRCSWWIDNDTRCLNLRAQDSDFCPEHTPGPSIAKRLAALRRVGEHTSTPGPSIAKRNGPMIHWGPGGGEPLRPNDPTPNDDPADDPVGTVRIEPWGDIYVRAEVGADTLDPWVRIHTEGGQWFAHEYVAGSRKVDSVPHTPAYSHDVPSGVGASTPRANDEAASVGTSEDRCARCGETPERYRHTQYGRLCAGDGLTCYERYTRGWWQP